MEIKLHKCFVLQNTKMDDIISRKLSKLFITFTMITHINSQKNKINLVFLNEYSQSKYGH